MTRQIEINSDDGYHILNICLNCCKETLKYLQPYPNSLIELEDDILDFDPFQDDYGDPADQIFQDKIVTARKGKSKCFCCNEEIEPKTRIRTMTTIVGGKIFYNRWCNKCCVAMAASTTGIDNEMYEQRCQIGQESRA